MFLCVCGICKLCLKRLEPTAGGNKIERKEKNNKRIHQEINVLLITFKTISDKANFAHFHKMNTREWYLWGDTAFFNLSWN